MKIRTDFVTNSSSSSFICSVIITDNEDNEYGYSLSDAYNMYILQDIGCRNYFKTGLNTLANKSVGNDLLGTHSVEELVNLLLNNIDEQQKYNWEDSTDEIADNKKEYLEWVTSNISELSDIKTIEFRTDVEAHGDSIEIVPSELIIPDEEDGFFEGFESTKLDVKTNKTTYTNSKEEYYKNGMTHMPINKPSTLGEYNARRKPFGKLATDLIDFYCKYAYDTIIELCEPGTDLNDEDTRNDVIWDYADFIEDGGAEDLKDGLEEVINSHDDEWGPKEQALALINRLDNLYAETK